MLAKFERWDNILALPEPAFEAPISGTVWRLARTLALAGKGAWSTRPPSGQNSSKRPTACPRQLELGNNNAGALVAIARPYLDGRIALMRGNFAEAIRYLREAVAAEDALAYDEPTPWYLPSREGARRCPAARRRPCRRGKNVSRRPCPQSESGRSLFELACGTRGRRARRRSGKGEGAFRAGVACGGREARRRDRYRALELPAPRAALTLLCANQRFPAAAFSPRWVLRRRKLARIRRRAGALHPSPRQAQRAPITRAIPSTGERLPAIGLGTWLTFSVIPGPRPRRRWGRCCGPFSSAAEPWSTRRPCTDSPKRSSATCSRAPVASGSFRRPRSGPSAGGLAAGSFERSRELWGVPQFDLVHYPQHARLACSRRDAQGNEGGWRRCATSASRHRTAPAHDEMERALTRERFDFAQFTYNLSDRARRGAAAAARRRARDRGGDQSALRRRASFLRRRQKTAAAVGSRVRLRELGAVLPEVRRLASVGDLRDSGDVQSRASEREYRRALWSAAGCDAAIADGEDTSSRLSVAYTRSQAWRPPSHTERAEPRIDPDLDPETGATLAEDRSDFARTPQEESHRLAGAADGAGRRRECSSICGGKMRRSYRRWRRRQPRRRLPKPRQRFAHPIEDAQARRRRMRRPSRFPR